MKSLVDQNFCAFIIADGKKYLAMTEEGIEAYEKNKIKDKFEKIYLDFFMDNKKVVSFKEIEIVEKEDMD